MGPIVLHKAYVVGQGVEAEHPQGIEIQFLNIVRRRFEQNLKLIVVLQAIGVFAVAAVGGPPTGLHIGGVPGFRTDGPQKGGRMESARAHCHVQGLQHHATMGRPEVLQGAD